MTVLVNMAIRLVFGTLAGFVGYKAAPYVLGLPPEAIFAFLCGFAVSFWFPITVEHANETPKLPKEFNPAADN